MNSSRLINFFQTVTDCKLSISDPYFLTHEEEIETGKTYGLEITGPHGHVQRIEWKSPLKNDSMPRSLVTCYCTKYAKINPARISGNPPPEQCERMATCWHRDFRFTKDEMRSQLANQFHALPFTSRLYALLCPTQYGIGAWIVFGIRQDILDSLADHLNGQGIPFKNEFSDARWVLRYKTGLPFSTNQALLDNLTGTAKPETQAQEIDAFADF